jgi:hypothetical protein
MYCKLFCNFLKEEGVIEDADKMFEELVKDKTLALVVGDCSEMSTEEWRAAMKEVASTMGGGKLHKLVKRHKAGEKIISAKHSQEMGEKRVRNARETVRWTAEGLKADLADMDRWK